jgi:DNA-binding HxlR family transcriptional regulator
MRGYGQFCPVAMGAEVFAERWTPLIVRELLLGSHRFGELMHGVPGIPRSVLTTRLADLRRAGVVEARRDAAGRGTSWSLTPAGRELGPVVEALGAWGFRHAVETLPEDHLDPDLFIWFARRRIQLERLPDDDRVVVEFRFSGTTDLRRWLVIEPPDIDVCRIDPLIDPDLIVSADAETFARAYLGQVDLGAATRDGRVAIDGRPALVRSFPRWFGVTHFVRYRERMSDPAFGG